MAPIECVCTYVTRVLRSDWAEGWRRCATEPVFTHRLQHTFWYVSPLEEAKGGKTWLVWGPDTGLGSPVPGGGL